MTVNCPICGKEVSSYFYLGQHITKTDDPAHNGEKADEIVEEGGKPENLVDEYRENVEEQEKQDEDDSMQLNKVPTTEEPADSPEYVKIDEVEVDGLTQDEIAMLKQAKEQGYTQIEKSSEPIPQRDVK